MHNDIPYDQLGPLERIQLKLSSLSKTQRKVGEYILEHFD